jgi:hypothetical protein
MSAKYRRYKHKIEDGFIMITLVGSKGMPA